MTGDYIFVGLDNYVRMLTHPQFITAIQNTLMFVVATVILELIFGFYLAVTLNKRLPGTSFFRMVYVMPMMMASIAAGFIWRLIFVDGNGVLNWMLNQIGITSITWFANATAARFMVLMSSLWGSLPFSILVLLAGLKSVPDDYYEAAQLDGASAWQRFTRITVPLMKNTITLVVIVRVSDAFRIYDQIVALTGGGPGHATSSITHLIFRRTFEDMRFGEGAASSFIMLAIVGVSCLLIFKAFRLGSDD